MTRRFRSSRLLIWLPLALGLAAASCFLPSPASAATLAAGDLIKLPDDGNPETTVDSAVYYYGADGKRYVFPNSQAYFTWYADFSAVKTVSSAEMAALPLGGNVTYRPGTRLVKITSDPNVYAVEPGGVLRWVQTEEVARTLYGDQWNKRIDDIPDAFFFNYTIGDPLAAAVYPDGTVVRRSSDGAYFRIEDRNKRRIASADVRNALRLQEQFVIGASGSLADYPDGADITGAETAITDTSQKNLVQAPLIPTFTVRLPATNYIAVGGEATLLELHISSAKEVNVRQLTVRLEATTGAPAQGATDDDRGGLVYENNAQPNFRVLRLVDAAGNEPFGRKELTLDIGQDQAQTFTYFGAFNVPAGSDKVLYFRAQTNTLLPTGEGYKAVFVASGTAVRDPAAGADTAFLPAADIAGPSLSTLSAFLEVTSSTVPGMKTYVRGFQNAEISGLTFKATVVAPNVIKAVTFQGYIDEEGTGGFLPGTDSDNGSETRVRDMVPAVSLYDDKGTKIAGPVEVDMAGRAAFTGLTFGIPAGQSAILVIRGDLDPAVELENQPNRLMFDITDAASDVTVVDDKGAAVSASGKLPNRGNTPSFYSTVRKNGTAKFTWNGYGGRAMAGRETLLGTLSVETKYDGYLLKTVTFRQVDSIAQSLSDVRLAYPDGSSTVSVSKQFIGNNVTFTGLNAVLKKEGTTELKLYGSILGKSAGAVYAEPIKVQFGNADALEFVSQTDGQSFSAADIGPSGSDFTVGVNTASNAVVRYSLLSAAKTTSYQPTTVYRDAATEVMRFTFGAEPEGAVRIRKMAFKLSPSDAGQAGPDNDALELWAKINGDFADDDGVVHLERISGTDKIVVGEDTATRLRYSIVRSGVKNTSPVASGYTSQPGDYALVEYEFDEGAELNIGAGGTQEFRFGLSCASFASDKDYSLNVELLGGADLAWTDVPSGAYTALTGSDAAGLPLSNSVSVKR